MITLVARPVLQPLEPCNSRIGQLRDRVGEVDRSEGRKLRCEPLRDYLWGEQTVPHRCHK